MVGAALGDVGADQMRSSGRCAEQQPADERVDGARARGRARPTSPARARRRRRWSTMKSTSSRNVRERLAVDRATRRRRRRARRRACSCGGDVVDDHRVLLALVLGVGEQERQQLVLAELGDRPVEGCDARACGWRRRARRSGRPCGAGRSTRDASRTAPARSPRRAVAVAVARRSSRVLAWSRKSRSSPFTLKISALVLIASAPSTPEWNRRVEQEGGVARLGGDAGDADDVDVRAAGAVEEVEVDVRAARRRGRARSGSLRSIRSKNERLVALARPSARRTSAPGQRRHEHLGLDPGRRAPPRPRLTSAGSTPSAMRNTSESKRAPSWRARTWVTTPESRDGLAARAASRSHTTTSSSCRYWPSAQRHPELQRRRVVGADDPTDRTAFSVVPHAGHVTTRGLPFQEPCAVLAGTGLHPRQQVADVPREELGGGNMSGSTRGPCSRVQGVAGGGDRRSRARRRELRRRQWWRECGEQRRAHIRWSGRDERPGRHERASDVRSRWRSDDRHRLRRLRRRLGRSRRQPRRRSRSATSTSRAARSRSARHERSTASTIAVKFINEQAGGIGGHPLEVVTCYIANDGGRRPAVRPAVRQRRLASSPSSTGPTFIGTESFYAALGDQAGRLRRVGQRRRHRPGERRRPVRRRQVHPGAVRDVRPRHAEGQVGGARLSGRRRPGRRRRRAGVRLRGGRASRSRWCRIPANTPDLTVPLLAAGAQDVDLVMPVINPNDCVKFEQAIQQLGIPDEKVLASPICINADDDRGLSATSRSGSTPSPRRSASTRPIPSVPPYTDILTAQGQDAADRRPVGAVGFGQIDDARPSG